MKRKRKTEIVVERDQVLVIRRLDRQEPRWCAECGGQAQLVNIDEGAALIGISARAIFRRVETGQVHFTETETGALFVCVNSLLNPG